MAAGARVDVLEQTEVAQGVEVVLGGALEDAHQVGLGLLGGQPLGDQRLQRDGGGLAAGRKFGFGPAARIEVHLRTKSSPENDS